MGQVVIEPWKFSFPMPSLQHCLEIPDQIFIP